VQRIFTNTPGRAGTASSRTPLHLLEGTITPNGLHFQRLHNGIPDIDPSRHELLIHGMVERPLAFSVETLMRYPMETHIRFIECSGNSGIFNQPQPQQMTAGELNGLLSCSEWTGVKLSVLLAEGLFEHQANEYKSIQVTRLIHDFYESDARRGFYGGGGIDARFDFYPAGFALAGLPADTPKWGLEFKKTFGHYFTRTISLLSHTTSLPVESNTVTLDPDVKDAWGLPAVRITYSPHPDDIATQAWMMQRQHEILEAMGAKKIWGDPIDAVGASRHLMGTCRMGNNPAKSVVNSYGRSHDVANLFVVDGSNFVTSARQQPTATIQALAYRSAENMVRLAKAGEV
jgi:hypothetical protein